MTLWPMMIRAAALICLLSFGLEEVTPAMGAPLTQATPATETVARIHWVGKNRISADTNAADLTRFWNMVETVKLQEQIFEKLSAAPWRFIRSQSNPASTNLLHPLLQDLLDQEFYLQVRVPPGSTNKPGELVLAIRLDESRARLWQTNVAAALESLTGIRFLDLSPGRHVLRKHHVPNLIELAQAGQWTLLGAAEDHNTLLDESIASIESGQAPFVVGATNSWFEADVDLPRVAAAVGHEWRLPTNFPAISVAIAGEGNAVRTRGELSLPFSVPIDSEPWNIPTNLISEDFIDFTAIRGGAPSFLSKFWGQFDTNPAPDQFFVWSLIGAPMEAYVAAPAKDASNAVSRLSDLVLRQSASWFHSNDLISFEKAKGSNALRWTGLPYISPSLESVETPGGSFILAGFFTPMAPGKPLPAGLCRLVQSRTNLLYYSVELTGMKVQQLTYLAQLARLAMNKSQLPAQSPAALWLKALGQTGQSRTEITCNGPRQFSFDRIGTSPFTALELQLLADWVESNRFPAPGLSTLEHR